MSKYEWERGSIVIPADQWVAFRRGLIEAHNNEQLRLFEVAKRVLVTVKLAGKGRRNYNWHEAIRTAAGDHDADAVLRMLGVVSDGVVKPRAPKRKDLSINPTSRGCTLIVNRGDAAIKLDDATRTVTWGVPENNHAVEYARSSTLGRALFTALARIDWKRGSGGTLVGNDEYNRCDDDEGGSANYVTARYGVAS